GDAPAQAARSAPAGGGPAVQSRVLSPPDRGGAHDRTAAPVSGAEPGRPAPPPGPYGAGTCGGGAGQPDARSSAGCLSEVSGRGRYEPALIVKKVYWLPLVVRPLRRFPALWSLPGHRPAQLARWPAVGNAAMSVPSSATITSAAPLPRPGIDS